MKSEIEYLISKHGVDLKYYKESHQEEKANMTAKFISQLEHILSFIEG